MSRMRTYPDVSQFSSRVSTERWPRVARFVKSIAGRRLSVFVAAVSLVGFGLATSTPASAFATQDAGIDAADDGVVARVGGNARGTQGRQAVAAAARTVS